MGRGNNCSNHDKDIWWIEGRGKCDFQPCRLWQPWMGEKDTPTTKANQHQQETTYIYIYMENI